MKNFNKYREKQFLSCGFEKNSTKKQVILSLENDCVLMFIITNEYI
jgi:hypothetical protein